MIQYPYIKSVYATGFGIYYILIAAGGCITGLITCIVTGMHFRWFVVYLLGILLLTAFILCRQHRRLALGLFTFFILFFVGKQIFSSGYSLIAGGPSSLGIFLYDIPLIFLLIYLITEKVFRRNASIYIPPVLIPLTFYIIWSGISTVNSAVPVLTLIEFIWLCKMAVILIIFVNLVKDRSDLILVISVLIAGLFVQEIITFSQAYFKVWYAITGGIEHTTLQSTTKPETFRAGGTVGVHNVQAAYYVLLISLSAGIYFIIQSRKLRFILLLVIFGGLYSVVITYSRNGYLSLVSALTVVTFFAWRKNYINRRHLIIGGWLLIMALLVIPMLGGGAVIERIRSRVGFDSRMEGISIALNMVREHPFAGVGLNNFSVVMGDHNYSPEGISSAQQAYFGGESFDVVVHNKYLLVASETGIVGLMLFIWILYIIFSYAFKLLSSQDNFYWGIGAGMIAAMTGASTNMLFDIFSADILITIFWVLVGLIFVSYKISLQEEQNRSYTKEIP